MSVPEKPYTRKEAYLNAAATGDTSGIPETPYTREEMYLDAIARNGGGGGGGGGSSTLSGLTDVDISNPTDGQTLVYDAVSGKWINGHASRIIVHVDDETGYADKTWQELYDATVAGVPVYFPYTPMTAPSGSLFKCMTRLNVLFGDSSNVYACTFNARDQANNYDVTFFAASANDYLQID